MDLSKTTAVDIEEVSWPSVTFHLDHQQNTGAKMAERRISSCSSAGQASDDLPWFANIPLIPAFLLCTLVIILVIFIVDDILDGFMWLNDKLTFESIYFVKS